MLELRGHPETGWPSRQAKSQYCFTQWVADLWNSRPPDVRMASGLDLWKRILDGVRERAAVGAMIAELDLWVHAQNACDYQIRGGTDVASDRPRSERAHWADPTALFLCSGPSSRHQNLSLGPGFIWALMAHEV
uniref:Uncharacterized protein n=1 Tax=Sphaerodactylus townsendi TaxID=933632 RepID=A0ACB8FM74_9SAUR